MKDGSPQLVPGTIQAVRSWELIPEVGTGAVLLGSWAHHTIWPQGEVSADCLRDWHQGEAPPPGPLCHCGIYAFHPHAADRDLLCDDEFGDRVAGVIDAWGRIEVHEDGIRAEHARVSTLFLDAAASDKQRDLIGRAAATYAAELIEVSGAGFDELVRTQVRGLDELFIERLLIRERPLYLEPKSIGYVSRRGAAVGGFGFVESPHGEPPKRFRAEHRIGSLLGRVVRVAGSQYHGDALQSEEFAPGRPLRLVPEPDNAHDPNAVAVWDAEGRRRVGYVPAELAQDVRRRLAAGRIASVHSVWQWRDMRTGLRTGLHMLIARTSAVTFADEEQLWVE